MVKVNIYFLKIGDKWKIGKWMDLRSWINNEFKENSEEIIKGLILKWKKQFMNNLYNYQRQLLVYQKRKETYQNCVINCNRKIRNIKRAIKDNQERLYKFNNVIKQLNLFWGENIKYTECRKTFSLSCLYLHQAIPNAYVYMQKYFKNHVNGKTYNKLRYSVAKGKQFKKEDSDLWIEMKKFIKI